jgi:hypothetical protein
MRKIVASASVVAVLVGAAWLGRGYIGDLAYRAQQPTLPPAVEHREIPSSTEPAPTGTPPTTEEQPTSTRPTSFNLEVPFTTQAPFANWDQPFQDACEEAAVLTVYHYWEDKPFTPEVARDEILAFVALENEQLGSPTAYVSTDAATTASMAEKMWLTYKTRVIYDWTIDDVEREIAAGRPVVGFFAGKELKNPNFKNGGPEYHALVIKGYTEDSFITNDVGTRRGADYVYTKQTLLDASHDWNNGDVLNGRSAVLILEKR